eukprot:8600407-Alexandrium_andersonii.AAC.1
MSFHSASVTNALGATTRSVAALPTVAGRALEATATGEAGTGELAINQRDADELGNPDLPPVGVGNREVIGGPLFLGSVIGGGLPDQEEPDINMTGTCNVTELHRIISGPHQRNDGSRTATTARG